MDAAPTPAHLAWRENGEERDGPLQLEKQRMDAARNRIIKTVQMKYPKKSMQAKAFVLNDLVKKVAAKRNNDHSNDQVVKDALHRRKPLISKLYHKTINKRDFVNKCYMLNFDKLTMTKYESPAQRHDVSQAMATLSCYDNRPREPCSGDLVPDSETPDLQPEVTRQLEDISLASGNTTYVPVAGNQAVQSATAAAAAVSGQVCDELCQQIVTSLCPLPGGFSNRFRE